MLYDISEKFFVKIFLIKSWKVFELTGYRKKNSVEIKSA